MLVASLKDFIFSSQKILNVKQFFLWWFKTEEKFDFPKKIIPATLRFLEDPLVPARDFYPNHIFKNFFLSCDKFTALKTVLKK